MVAIAQQPGYVSDSYSKAGILSEMPHTVAGLCLLKSVLAIHPGRQASEMWGTQEPISGAVETRPSHYKVR